MTKREASDRLLRVARSIREDVGGDPVCDLWAEIIESVAWDLFPHNPDFVDNLRAAGTSRKTKLRALIEHPGTTPEEREAAVGALARLRERDAMTS